MGDLWDMAKEASAKRVEKEGNDLMTKKWFSDYSKQRNGKKNTPKTHLAVLHCLSTHFFCRLKKKFSLRVFLTLLFKKKM